MENGKRVKLFDITVTIIEKTGDGTIIVQTDWGQQMFASADELSK